MMGTWAVVGLAPDHPAHLEAVHARQVEVEEHEVDAPAHGLEALLAGPRHLHLEADLLELVGDGLGDVAVVLDEEHAPPGVRTRGAGRRAAARPRARPRPSRLRPPRDAWWRTSLRLDEEDHVLGDVRGVVGDALEVAADQDEASARSMVPGSAIM